jgi:excisionase family DNA binding protein
MTLQVNGVTYDAEVPDLAKRYGKSLDYIRDLARAKKIPGIKSGREWRFSTVEVDKVLLKQPQEPSLDDLANSI